MKNKKLFAILTLVCFMFTLMPVAAFAAYNTDVKANQYVVKVQDGDIFVEDVIVVAEPVANVTVEAYKGTDALADVQGAAYYVVNADGKAVQIAYDEELDGAAFTIKAPGTYTVYGVIDNPRTANTDLADLVASANSLTSDVTVEAAVAKIEAKLAADIIRTAATVTVEAAEAEYSISATAPAGAIDADGGFTDAGTKVVTVTIMNGTQPVVGKAPTIVAPDYLTVTPKNPKKAVTNAAGVIEYKISANKSGNFEVVFSYEDAEEATVNVVVNKGDIKNVEVVKESATLINNERNADGIKTGAVVKFTAADGAMISVATTDSALTFAAASGLNETDGVLATQVIKAAVVSQPAASKLTAANLELVPSTTEQGAFELVVKSAADLKVGSYEVRFALANNDYVTVAFEAAKMGDTVGIRFVQPATTIASGAESLPTFTVQAYDAKGVTETLAADDYTVSFQGKALAGAGVSSEEKFIGSTITVLAKTDDNKFVATTTLEVVASGNEVVYANTTAEVGVTTTLKANVVDTKGNKVAVDAEDTMNIVVLEKPANAYVSADVTGVTNGKDINVTFLASVAGEYKIQTIIVDDETNKFVTGIATIVVGGNATDFNDVVISIGADKMIVNNEVVALDVAPFIENNRTMMQFNVLNYFGFDVDWIPETTQVVAEGNGIKVVMTLNSKVATVNGEEVVLDVAPYSLNNRTVVPVGFLTGTFGITPNFGYGDTGLEFIIFTAK